eukprot:15337114-Ditylum_brightwellii.AAC.1
MEASHSISSSKALLLLKSPSLPPSSLVKVLGVCIDDAVLAIVESLGVCAGLSDGGGGGGGGAIL